LSSSDIKTPHEHAIEARIVTAQQRLSSLVHALHSSNETLTVARSGVTRATDELTKVQARLAIVKKGEAKQALNKNKATCDELDREIKRLDQGLTY
jgi:cell fate (sporulation/competence/biofilm development) regulator YmcA (YheA/YmcA/DUF963 family)